MSDTEFEDGLVTAEQIARLDAIFDRTKPIDTDEDLLKLADLVDSEAGNEECL